MKAMWVCALLVLCLWPTAAHSDPHDDLAQTNELRAINPDAAELFEAAMDARNEDDFEAASRLFARVREMAPGFVHATRRQCLVELHLQNHPKAIGLCEEALKERRSVKQHNALAHAIIESTYTSGVLKDDIRALKLVRDGIKINPDDPLSYKIMCTIGLNRASPSLLEECTQNLYRLQPQDPETKVYAMYLALMRGDTNRAKSLLNEAREHGLSEDGYLMLNAHIADERPFYYWWQYSALRSLLLWLGLLLALFVAGIAFSRRAGALADNGGADSAGDSARWRRWYARLLWWSCFAFQVSIPLSFVMVLAVIGVSAYGAIEFEVLPQNETLLIVLVLTVGLGWLVRHAFAIPRLPKPGMPVEPTPELRACLDASAALMETRPVDAVYLTSGHGFDIVEAGRIPHHLEGTRERRLVVGAAGLGGMTQAHLQALLAREYGHFSGLDGARGGFGRSIVRSTALTLAEMTRRGLNNWSNPVWWATRVFERAFAPMAKGAGRFQRALSTRWVAQHHGAEALADSEAHLKARRGLFDAHMTSVLDKVDQGEPRSVNLFTFSESSPNGDTVWALFGDRAALEQAVTARFWTSRGEDT